MLALALLLGSPQPSGAAALGLVAAYSFDENGGAILTDASGNGRDGSVSGAAWTAGRYGSALAFDGADDSVTLPSLGTFYDSAFTLEAWVKKTTTSGDAAVLGSWVGADGGGPMIWVDHVAGRYRLTLSTGLSNYLDSTREPVVGAWEHVAATYDGSVARFYVGGQEVATRPFGADVGDSDAWRIGAYGNGPAGFFDGVIDEVRIYSRALAPTEIQADMETSVGTPDLEPPAAPPGLAQESSTATSITVSWGTASDNLGVVAYDLYRDAAQIAATDGTSYSFTGLTCGTSYDLGVEARDAAGNRSSRSTVRGATLPCDPGAQPGGLLAAYAFDEGGGALAVDASDRAGTASISGAAWTTGRFGSALSFGGAGDRVDLSPLGMFYPQGFTLEAWVKPRSARRDAAILGSWVASQGGGPMIWVDHLAGRYFLTLGTGSPLTDYLDSGRLPAVGTWQHVAATFDGSTARFFVDGSQVASRVFLGTVGASDTWRVGAYGGSPTGFFDGVIDEVRAYDRALGTGEIQADMDSSIGPADIDPPTAPTHFAKTASGATTISTSWSASADDVAVEGYNLFRGGTLVSSTSSTQYTFSGLACSTAYDLAVEAVDAAGNTSARVGLTAATKACDTTSPTVSIGAPPNGDFVFGTIPLAADAGDDDAVAGVQFEVDGNPLGEEDPTAPYGTVWDTRASGNGTHVLTAVARDPSGNTARSAPVTVTVDNSAPPSPNLVAAYAFDEGVGGSAADSSGNGNPGAVLGATWTSDGRFGTALSFDGVNDMVTLPSLGTFYKTGFTLEAWVRKGSAARDVAALGSWAGGQEGGPMVWVDHQSGRYDLTLNRGSANYLDSTRSPAVGQWEHLAATYDGSTARFYVDGVETASRSFAGNVGDSDVWRVGAYNTTPAGFFDGVIDEVRIYDRALGPAEIQGDMTTRVRPPDTTPPTIPGGFHKADGSAHAISTAWSASQDNIGVTGYRLFRDGAAVGSTSTHSFTFTGLTCGTTYELGVSSVDAAGNVSAPARITETTMLCDTTPPSVALSAPAAGATLSGTVTLSAAASDDDAVAGVQFRLDGNPLAAEDTAAPYSLLWDTRTAAAGAHELTAVARDPSGNSTISTAVPVSVDNGAAPPPGLVAAYSFDEGSGTTALDDSGHGNTGVVTGADWAVGRFGSSLAFDGTDDWVTVADADALDLSIRMTLEAWVLPTSSGSAWHTVLFKERTNNLAYDLYASTNSGMPSAGVFVDGTEVEARGPAPLARGRWTHLAATYDGATLRLYVDGVEAASRSLAGAIPSSTGPLRIGGNGIWPEWFKGRIDEVRVYDRVLSASEIRADLAAPVAHDTDPPRVLSRSPAPDETDVTVGVTVKAAFNEALDPASVGQATVELRDPSGGLVPAHVGYDEVTATATLRPEAVLGYGARYAVTVRGGAAGVRDLAGNPLPVDVTWSFTTEPPAPPMLLVTSASNPFSGYAAELLRAEGLNDFSTIDSSFLTPSFLDQFAVVVLGDGPVSDAQAGMLGDWVTAGGNLVALRPDKRLAGLLGLADAGGTLGDGYLLVDTVAGPGRGLVSETVQFHGPADRYTPAGATAVATLYSDATTATPFPAVTLRDVGSAGGQAASFTYDLARSVVYTRQGNPAWAGEDRDGIAPVRTNDLFFGAAAADPKADWVDLAKIAIPQADEQQRLLANLILTMTRDQLPLPRFWYLPRGERAAVVMTGDDHALGGTAGRFDQYRALSPQGCSVAAWECVRSTSYVYPSSPLSDAQAAAYAADGFEIAVHVSTQCQNWTPLTLEADFASDLRAFADKYTSIPAVVSNRTHCVAWSDWVSEAKTELAHGIRLDTNYYHYPAGWLATRPGFMTGSGEIMRFADVDGSPIDVFQAATQMTDESGQPYPETANALLDRALGPEGYYGVFTANMHTDQAASAGSDAIVSAALARDVPVVSAKQMLDWVDARDRSSFRSFTWSEGRLGFAIKAASGASGLQAMLPLQGPTGALSALERDGSALFYTTQTVKGIDYAVFSAATGTYEATYG